MYFSLYYFLEEDRWDFIKAIKYYIQNVFFRSVINTSEEQSGFDKFILLQTHIDTMFL